ncbi:transcriptional regulator [Clostridium sp. MT-14]|uniref:transcriptional regulator n=1 Tax=Clostridium sp. MT-14 TaxID=3348360 RepID=UPI0035F36464
MELLEIDCRDLQEQVESIEWDIKHCNVCVTPDSHMSPSFGEKVQTSPTGESVAEKGIVREIEKLEDELEYVGSKLRRNRARIRQLKRNIAPLKKVLTVPPLSEEIMKFITYKYKLNKSVGWIANEMYGGVRSTAYRWREDILEDIVRWGRMYGNS